MNGKWMQMGKNNFDSRRVYKRTDIGKKLTVEIEGESVDLWIKDWNGDEVSVTVDRAELLAALAAKESDE